MKSLRAIEVRRGWLSKPLVESSQGQSELGRRPRNGRQRSMGAQQIHSYSYSQILLSLSLTQTDLQFQTSCCHVKQIFVPNAELCRKDKAGCYCSNRKCWVASDDANKHLNLLQESDKSQIFYWSSQTALGSPSWLIVDWWIVNHAQKPENGPISDLFNLTQNTFCLYCLILT